MSQQRKLTRKEKAEKEKSSTAVQQKAKSGMTAERKLQRQLGLIVAAIGFLLYIGTVSYSYTLDDRSAIQENSIVQKGFSGIGTLLKTSYRYGYWSSTDELYRPLSLVMFAIEWDFFPDSPGVFHFVQVLLYALTGFLLFNLLCRLFKNNVAIALIASLLFMAHPVHTEVTANIKSGDEVLSFLFGILSIGWLLDYVESKKISKIVFAAVGFFLALMAKESAITLIAIIPLILFVFNGFSVRKSLANTGVFIGSGLLYIGIRASVLHGITQTKKLSFLDNVIAGAPDFLSHLATAIYVLGRYLLLLVFPNHLSIDYSYSEIPLFNFNDYRVFISLGIYFALLIFAIYQIRKRDTISFGILFYLATIFIVSNIVLVIGTVMADRLLYVPSLGFCLVVSLLLIKILKAKNPDLKINTVADFIKQNSKPLLVTIIILMLYSFKTLDRQTVWKNNMTLYRSGTKDSPNSSRAHYFLGIGLKSISLKDETDSLKRKAIFAEMIREFRKSIELYPSNFDAYRDLGRAYDEMNDIENAIQSFDMALKCNPGDPLTLSNKGTIYFRQNKFQEAMDLFQRAVQANPRYADALKNLGSCYGTFKDYDNALLYFNKSLACETDNEKKVVTYRMIAMTYQYLGNSAMAETFVGKANQQENDNKNK